MEGRVHPDIGDEPPLLSSPPPPRKNSGTRRSHETYVIQIPKDQVYRVPPPENARIAAERFRSQPETKGNKPGLSRPMMMAIIAVVVCLVLGATGLILYLLLRPEGPSFSVSKVSVVAEKSSSSCGKKKQPEYEISLEATNPNRRLGIEYQTSENVTLLFGGKDIIATGIFPQAYQEKSNSMTVKLVLVGKNDAALPREPKAGLKLCLEMNVNMKMDLGFAKTWRMDSKASCHFKVTSLAAASKVLSNRCQISSFSTL